MDDQRHADGFPRRAGQFRPMCGGRSRESIAGHFRVPDAGLFEYRAGFHYPRAPAAAFGPLPAVFGEVALAVTGFQSGADAVLQGL